jgi:excisionase family DNA binding protein
MNGTKNPTVSARTLLDVHNVAELLGCSSRHVRRLVDVGRMPRPLKLGALVRWNRQVIEDWINDGCLSNSR